MRRSAMLPPGNLRSQRLGKHLFVELGDGPWLLLHLGEEITIEVTGQPHGTSLSSSVDRWSIDARTTFITYAPTSISRRVTSIL